MAYVDFDFIKSEAATRAGITAPVRLSPLQWSAVAVARNDSLATLQEPSRMARALAMIFDVGEPHNPRLADDNLEALRRAAVHAWHGSVVLPEEEHEIFSEAGFSQAHYDLVRASVIAARDRTDGQIFGRAFS